MKILVIGGGGREHALVWKLSQSSKAQKLYCAPGNGGIRELSECVDIAANNIPGLLQFAQEQQIDLTVVGPEEPLSLGIVDAFRQKGLKIFGPSQKAAMLEVSKAFSKDFMNKYQIPTASYEVFDAADEAINGLRNYSFPVVIKADGLAAGKGVIIAEDRISAEAAINAMLQEQKFGSAGSRVVIEEFLDGKEVSVLAFVDGDTIIPMADAQDYKRALDGDSGLNTGGMGAVSPSLNYKKECESPIYEEILSRTLNALKAENIEYQGVLYFGLMLTATGPKLLEYNVRFGDPETEVILPRLETDLVDIIDAIIGKNLNKIEINWKKEAAVCVVMSSGGYPEAYKTGYEITGLDQLEKGVLVFHSGTKYQDGRKVTSGGRVLAVTALGDDISTARKKAYKSLAGIEFENKHYRSDIASVK